MRQVARFNETRAMVMLLERLEFKFKKEQAYSLDPAQANAVLDYFLKHVWLFDCSFFMKDAIQEAKDLVNQMKEGGCFSGPNLITLSTLIFSCRFNRNIEYLSFFFWLQL